MIFLTVPCLVVLVASPFLPPDVNGAEGLRVREGSGQKTPIRSERTVFVYPKQYLEPGRNKGQPVPALDGTAVVDPAQ